MATIHEAGPDHATGLCTLCDGPAAAYWRASGGTVEVCYACAVDVLPRLIADAVPYLTREYVERAAERIDATYHRAMTARLIRASDQTRRAGGAA